MKLCLIPLALLAGNALACPADGSKDAQAPQAGQTVAASTLPAKAAIAAAVVTPRAAAPAVRAVKVSTQPAEQPRKGTAL